MRLWTILSSTRRTLPCCWETPRRLAMLSLQSSKRRSEEAETLPLPNVSPLPNMSQIFLLDLESPSFFWLLFFFSTFRFIYTTLHIHFREMLGMYSIFYLFFIINNIYLNCLCEQTEQCFFQGIDVPQRQCRNGNDRQAEAVL